jgi:nitrite reductase (NADH) small subunit
VKVEDGLVSLRTDELASHATDLTRPVAGPVCRKT